MNAVSQIPNAPGNARDCISSLDQTAAGCGDPVAGGLFGGLYTDEQIECIREGRTQSPPVIYPALAERTGLTIHVCTKIATKLGLTKPAKKLTPEQVRQAKAWLEQDKPWKWIAAQLGVQPMTIQNACRDPSRQEEKQVFEMRCLGPGAPHKFMSWSRSHNRICDNCKSSDVY